MKVRSAALEARFPVLRDDLAQHLSLPVGTVARRDFVVLRPDMTVEGALSHIRITGVGEKLIYFYVTDSEDQLVGVVPTRRLLASSPQTRLQDLMVSRVIAIPETATLLDACELFVLHKFLAFPVVDSSRRMKGVVDIAFFAAEVFQLGEEERPHQEIFETIGFHVEQLRHASVWMAFQVRFPWLLGTITSGLICAFLAGAFETTLAEALVIAFFLPLVLGLNESISMQSMSLSLQRLLRQAHHRSWQLRGVRREVLTSSLLGFCCAIIVGLVAFAWRKSLPQALVISGTLVASLVLSGLLGFFGPLLLRLGRRDLKIASGPVTLALVDVTTLLLYFTMARLFL